nr:hypothetical protein [Tanacetum cinerariifolium]
TGSSSKGTTTKKGRTVTLTTEDMQKRKNDVKIRITLLLALLGEHQLRFSKYKTAQELWATILKTFRGNEATKKTKKNLLKQQYRNFKAEGSETLEQTFNRLQAIVSHLQFMDIEIEQDDLNQKFLTSLAPEWLMHIIVWRNRSDLDTMSLDDLYNHLKVGKEDVNTASIPTASTNVSPASVNIGAVSISQNMALLSMMAGRFWKKTGKKISIQGTDVARFDKSKVECFNCHKMGHFTREYRAPRSQDRGRRDNYRQGSKVEEQALKALMVIDEKNTKSLNSKITDLTDKLCDSKNMLFHYKEGLSQVEETLKEEKEGLESKLTGFKSATKDLDNLIGSQRSDKIKEGLGYSAVPPPAQVYSPPKKDMSWTGLSEFADDTITDYTMPSLSVESNPNDLQNSSSSASENGESTGGILSKPEIKFVRPADSLTVAKSDKKETVRKPSIKYAELYRKPTKRSNVRGNQRNWNNLKSQQLGNNFVMKKACYNCGGIDHLSYDYGKRVDHGSLWAKNNNTHKSKTPRTVFHKTNRPPIRTNRPYMNAAQPKRTSFYKPAHSYNKRPFQRTSAVRYEFRGPRVATVTRKFPTVNRKLLTVNRKFPTSNTKFSTVDMGNKGKAIKASACWIWKPLQNLSNKGINSSNLSGTKDATSQEVKKDVSSLRYIALLNWVHDALMESPSSNAQDTCKADAPESSGNLNPTASTSNPLADQMETLIVETPIPTVSSPVPTACFKDSLKPTTTTRIISKRVTSQDETPSLDTILTLANRFDDILGVTTSTVDSHEEEADESNMETTITASPTPTLKIHKDHPKSQIIDPVDTPIQTRHKSKEMEEQSFIAIIHQKTNPTLL